QALSGLAAPALEAPKPGAAASGPGAKPPAEEELRTLRAEVAELDDLLEGIGETHAQLRALQKTAGGVERTRQLAELLVEQLIRQSGRENARQGWLDKLTGIASELQGGIAALEQKLGAGIDQVQRELGQVRAAAEQLRLVPAGSVFTSLERSARDSAQMLAKQVAFEA